MIELPEDDGPEAVRAMVEYFYTSDYSPSDTKSASLEGLQSDFDDVASNMLFDIQVYALADRLQLNALRLLAEHKFDNTAAKNWVYDEFPEAIKKVYDVAPPGPRGQELRNIVIKYAAENAKALFQNDLFSTVLGDVAEFGRDLSSALCGFKALRYNEQNAARTASDTKFRCGECGTAFSLGLEKGFDFKDCIRCPVCTNNDWAIPVMRGKARKGYDNTAWMKAEETVKPGWLSP